jgi:hypothetical protein
MNTAQHNQNCKRAAQHLATAWTAQQSATAFQQQEAHSNDDQAAGGLTCDLLPLMDTAQRDQEIAE